MNEAGLYVVPKKKRRNRWLKESIDLNSTEVVPGATAELFWREGNGPVQKKIQPWRRPRTLDAIDEWIASYRNRVSRGYLPKGFSVAPTVVMVRLQAGERTILEWTPGGVTARAM